MIMLRQIADLTRQIAPQETEEVFAAWLALLIGSAIVRDAAAREFPVSEEVKKRLMEYSPLAREIIEAQEHSSIERKIRELKEQVPEIGERLESFYNSYREIDELLSARGYRRPIGTRDTRPIP